MAITATTVTPVKADPALTGTKAAVMQLAVDTYPKQHSSIFQNAISALEYGIVYEGEGGKRLCT